MMYGDKDDDGSGDDDWVTLIMMNVRYSDGEDDGENIASVASTDCEAN